MHFQMSDEHLIIELSKDKVKKASLNSGGKETFKPTGINLHWRENKFVTGEREFEARKALGDCIPTLLLFCNLT